MDNRNQRVAGIVLSYIQMGIGLVIPLLYTPIMLRILGQEAYGLYSLSASVTGHLSLLSLGLGGAVLPYLMKSHAAGDREGFRRTAGLFQGIFCIAGGAAVLVGFGLTACTGTLFAQGLSSREIGELNTLLAVMALQTAVTFAGTVYHSIISCFERHGFQKLLGLAGTVALPLVNLAALYMGYGSLGLAWAGVLISGATALCNARYCAVRLGVLPEFRGMPVGLLREILPFSLFVFLSIAADLLFWSVDQVFLGAMVGAAAVAVYRVGTTFQSILQSMGSAISGVFAPEVNRLVASGGDRRALSDWMIRVGRLQFLVLSLAVSGFAVFGRAFLRFWAGEGYEEAYAVALLTMGPITVPLIQNVAYTATVAMNRHRFRAVLYLLLAVANAAATFLLIPVMGITGAALCTGLALVLGQGVILNRFYHRRIGLDIPGFWKNILQMSPVPLGMTAAGLLMPEPESLWALLAGMVCYTAVFCGLSWLVTLNRREKDFLTGRGRP